MEIQHNTKGKVDSLGCTDLVENCISANFLHPLISHLKLSSTAPQSSNPGVLQAIFITKRNIAEIETAFRAPTLRVKMSSSDLLPLPWLVEASIYNVKIGNDTVITTVADHAAIFNSSISKLKSELKSTPNTPNPFVGVDVVNNGDLLLFHVKNRCLIIQFKRLVLSDNQNIIPQSLKEFLYDRTITFIGPRNISQKSTLSYLLSGRPHWEKLELNRIVDVGYLAANLLKKPKLLSSTLEELMGEVDVDNKKPVISEGSIRLGWQSSSVLSEEEVKLAMYEVHSCYQIASKLADVISASVSEQ